MTRTEEALREWAEAVADNQGFYDPREADDLRDKLIAETPVAASIHLGDRGARR